MVLSGLLTKRGGQLLTRQPSMAPDPVSGSGFYLLEKHVFPLLPDSVNRLTMLLFNRNRLLQELVAVIESDPVLLLYVWSCPVSRDRPVGRLEEQVRVFGQQQVMDLLRKALSQAKTYAYSDAIDYDAFYKHALLSGLFARQLVRHTPLPSPDLACAAATWIQIGQLCHAQLPTAHEACSNTLWHEKSAELLANSTIDPLVISALQAAYQLKPCAPDDVPELFHNLVTLSSLCASVWLSHPLFTSSFKTSLKQVQQQLTDYLHIPARMSVLLTGMTGDFQRFETIMSMKTTCSGCTQTRASVNKATHKERAIDELD